MVGVEPLNQFLEARLDVGLGGRVLEIELAQALPFQAFERSLGLVLRLYRPLDEQAERVLGGETMGESAGPGAVSIAIGRFAWKPCT